ncbi:hypothetical protein [Aeromicrobium sp.]|uniref:hypothetical protein n=1 Tax=Aeromicrobium sp. TaxID=1871063 RepID=UPI002FC8F909
MNAATGSPRPTSLERTQRWVISALISAVAAFPTGALIVVTHVIRDDDPATAVALCIMTGVLGIIAVVAILLMHKRSPLSFFLCLGLIPAIGSAIWTFVF